MGSIFILMMLVMFVAKSSGMGAGEYEYIEIEEILHCRDQESEWKVSVNMRNDAGTLEAAVNATIGAPLDEHLSAELLVESASPVGWQPFYPYSEADVCEDAMEKVPELFKIIEGCIHKSLECPIPAGEYFCDSAPLRYHFDSFKELMYGKYRLSLKVFVDGDQKLCMKAFANVIPKDKKTKFG